MAAVAALFCGLVFGLGLVWSGMTDPAKVQGFLDLAGAWDPTLAFVMGGAVLVTLPGFAWLRRRRRPLIEPAFSWPAALGIDARLVTGSVLFGIGWGLSGFCPGPAIVNLAGGSAGVLVFCLAMVAGMFGHKLFAGRR